MFDKYLNWIYTTTVAEKRGLSPIVHVTIAPRLLSYLRINQPVTGLTARLDTGPVASGYPDGVSTR